MPNQNDDVPVMVPPQFARFMAEFFGDKRAVLWPVANILQRQFSLNVAQTQTEIELEGDFLYADSDSTGVMYVKINNPAMPWIPVRTNFGIEGFPIRRIFVKWAAQAGKQINLLYGYGARIIPPNQDITTIGSIANPVTLNPWVGKNRTGSPGFMGVGSITPSANARVQLFNPVASGKNFYVDSFVLRSSAAGAMELYFHNAVLGALAMNGQNKQLDGAPGIGELRTLDGGSAAGTLVKVFTINGVPSERIPLEEPLIIPPGYGAHWRNPAAATVLTMSAEWREVPV